MKAQKIIITLLFIILVLGGIFLSKSGFFSNTVETQQIITGSSTNEVVEIIGKPEEVKVVEKTGMTNSIPNERALNEIEEVLLAKKTTQDIIKFYKEDNKNHDESVLHSDVLHSVVHSSVGSRLNLLVGMDVCYQMSEFDLLSSKGKEALYELMGEDVTQQDKEVDYILENGIESFNECTLDELCNTNNEMTETNYILYMYINNNLTTDQAIDNLMKVKDSYKAEDLTNYMITTLIADKLRGQDVTPDTCDQEFSKYELNDFSGF